MMARTNRSAVFIFLTFMLAACNQAGNKQNRSISPHEDNINRLLSEMTLEEKIGQMTLFTSDWDVTGPTIRSGYKQDIIDGKVGAIFNAFGVDYVRQLQQMAVDCTRMKIPLIFGYDVIHGYKTIFPMPIGQAASWDIEAIERSERIAAVEASAEGLHWTFTPMVDIARDPRWGRIAEGSGEDTFLSSLIAAARVRGFQGDDLSKVNTMAACAKHYAAYGAAQAGRDYHTVDISNRTLHEVYLPPFKATVDAGVATFMTAFNEINGVPATGNRYLLTEILKDQWNFNGFVVTDYTSVEEMIDHGIVADKKEAAELALHAGVDMDMQSAAYYEHLNKSWEEGKVSMDEIDDAVRRILRVKFMLGLFDDPYKYFDNQREKEMVMRQEHFDFAREFAAKSIVLLKNENEVLPLSKTTGTIAVIGPLADSKRDMIGSWSAAGDYQKSVTLLEGVREKVPAARVHYAKGCDVTGDDKTGFAEAVSAASRADVILLGIGEHYNMTGEAASRSGIKLPGVQKDLTEALLKLEKPVVVVLMSGRPLNLTWFDENVPAILETWYLGTQAGHAMADVLFGDYNPTGKLTVTFPRNIGQVPIFYNMKNTGRPFASDDKYTTKYLDVPNTPLYPFGYGLSYTTFEYSGLKLSKTEIDNPGSLEVWVTVKNTGKYPGGEVVQLYIRDLIGSVTRPVKELKDFKKIHLDPGKSEVVKFDITTEDLKFLDIDMNIVVEPGDFEVFAGTNSHDVVSAKFKLK